MKLKKLTALFLAGAMSLSLAACGSSGSSAAASTGGTEETASTATSTESGDLPTLKVAVMPFLNSLPIEYMVQNGLDEANGFKIETVYFSNGTAMNEALAADQWEVGTLSAAAVNSLAIYGAYCIADVAHSEGVLYTLVDPESPIAQASGTNPSYPEVLGSPDTVKGAVIATSTGTISHLNVNKWLEVLGLTPDDVQIVSMDFPAAYQALKTGNCDVAALNPPTSFTAESEGFVVTSSLSTLNVPQYDSIIVSNKAYNERRDVLVNYVKAFFQACDALQADPDMAAQMLVDWYTANGQETTLEACATEIETRPFVTSDEAKGITIGESVAVTGEFWVSQQLLEESRFPEIAAHVDDSIVKEALGF